MKKIVLFFAVAMMVSCSNDLEDLNKNIKDPSEVTPESLFTGAQKNFVDQMVTLHVNWNNTKLWAQYLQQTTYTNESNYDQASRTIPDNHWDIIFLSVIKDLDEAAKVIKKLEIVSAAELEVKENKLGIIEILTVMAYTNLVETFGNIPYAEALNTDKLSPKYDDGLTIYKDLISRLSKVIAALDETKGSFGSADRIYSGDVSKWKKFANTLKLRMGILLADVDSGLARTTVMEAVNDGVFTSNGDNALYAYLSADPNTNPIYNDLVLSGRLDYVAGETIVDILNDLNDPRLPLFFTPTADGTYVGAKIGELTSYDKISHLTKVFETPTFSGTLLDYSETEFLLAEAVARGFLTGGSVKEHYENGIKASIDYWGGNVADADAYLLQSNVNYDLALAASTASVPWKEVIGKQKYIALFNRGFEAWTSIRLLDYPAMKTPSEAVSGFPNRYTYPIAEQTLNRTNYESASKAIGGDAAETRLFWDLH